MSTLGNSVTPTWPTYGFVQQVQKAVAGLYTVPAGGGVFQSVSFWASCDGATQDYIWGVIWDSSGNLLKHGAGVLTTGGNATTGHVGATQFYTDTFAVPIFIAGGTQIYIGWQPNSSTHTTDWGFNGSTTPVSLWATASGTPGNVTFGTTSPTYTGQVAAYATYVPAGGYIMRSSVWTAGPVTVDRSGVQTAASTFVFRSGIWQPGS